MLLLFLFCGQENEGLKGWINLGSHAEPALRPEACTATQDS